MMEQPIDKNVLAAMTERAGKNFEKLSAELGLTRYALKKLYAELEVPAPESKSGRFKRLDIPKERIEGLIREGKNRAQMQKALGISNRGLMNLLARYGLHVDSAYDQSRKLAGQGLRRCSQCKAIKTLEVDFYPSKADVTGKNRRCKACSVAWLHAFREKWTAQRKALRNAPPEILVSPPNVIPLPVELPPPAQARPGA